MFFSSLLFDFVGHVFVKIENVKYKKKQTHLCWAAVFGRECNDLHFFFFRFWAWSNDKRENLAIDLELSIDINLCVIDKKEDDRSKKKKYGIQKTFTWHCRFLYAHQKSVLRKKKWANDFVENRRWFVWSRDWKRKINMHCTQQSLRTFTF